MISLGALQRGRPLLHVWELTAVRRLDDLAEAVRPPLPHFIVPGAC